MKIRQSFWDTPLRCLHAWLMLAAFWTLPLAVVGFVPADTRKMLFLSGILFLPVVISHILIRKTKALWSYLIFSLAVIPLAAFFGYRLAEWMQIAAVASVREGAVNQMFKDGVPHQAALMLSLLLSGLFSLICMVVRGSSRIRKGQMLKAFEEMQGGGSGMKIEDWEITTFLDDPRPLQWICYVVIYLLDVLLQADACYRFVFACFFLDVFIWLLCTYEERLYLYIKDHQKIASLPVETMQRVCHTVMLVAVLVLLACTIPSILYGREPLADWVKNRKPVEHEVVVEFPEMPENAQGGGMDPEMQEYLDNIEPIEWPEWVKKLTNGILYLIILFVAQLIIREFLTGIRQMNHAFSRETEDEVIFLDRVGKDQSQAIKKERGGLDLRGTPNQKIRKLYKKMLKKQSKRIPQPWEAPMEIEKNSGFTEKEGSRMIHELYEKARYSQTGCSPEDVNEMQKFR